MANYTAADVKRLRELTGSGMMDCKNALAENDGDFDKAVETLRVKGAKDVGKRAERTTGEGLVATLDGVLVELNCETDFVAKGGDFQSLAERVVKAAAAARPQSTADLEAADLDGKTVKETVDELSAKIGEKLALGRVASFDGKVATYLHQRSSDLPPAIGVLVEYTGEGDKAAEAADWAAKQIAALKAKYLSRDDVPEEVVAQERRVAEEITRSEGKPEQAIPKIVEGRVGAFYKDVVLLEQASLADPKQTVANQLKSAGAGIVRFVRFEVGQN
ncbi:translation elongation factor Ts [Segniliparus rugosus]|uniref:Elongation factor Ts n=1 Tax=Segniliparus rugosus (strain ATCC BAA-974 / DSM 45345 / CCUG 50838 / CIP 108380 / JCM 13579 / CDC 945) TaxID=679197 RepID=E5XU08_SEGRC|nr:translation elongation factor Ts [Segniliparus rugosus]EFV12177.1 elongation factor Ts [Segniliparus rugosus ATCC BAA-974]